MSTDLDHAIRATLEIEKRRARTWDEMKEAVRTGDDAAVVRCARSLCGEEELDGEAESDRPAPRLGTGASRA